MGYSNEAEKTTEKTEEKKEETTTTTTTTTTTVNVEPTVNNGMLYILNIFR